MVVRLFGNNKVAISYVITHAKDICFNVVTPSGMLYSVAPACANAINSLFIISERLSADANLLLKADRYSHPPKTLPPISVTLSGIVISVKPVHSKAQCSIFVKLLGSVICFRL